jgi:YbbR domain-containing protein
MSKLMSRNTAAKLISIFFALLLWLYVMSVINPRITTEELNIPVQFLNESIIRQSGLVVFGQPEPTIRVRMTGNRDQVHRITRDNIQATIDLRGHTEGTNSIPIEVTVPGGVQVDWSPRFATIRLERVISRQREVTVNIAGQPATGYVLGEPQLRPDLVWIEGPESFVSSVESVTAELVLEAQTENISLSLPLRAVNSQGEEVPQVDVRTAFVDLFIPVDQLKSVGIDLDSDIQAAQGYQIVSIIVNPVNLTVRGQEQVLSNISRVSTEPVVLEDMTESTEVVVPIAFPEGVSAFEESEVRVRIEVEEVIDEVFVISRENVVTTGLEPDLLLDQSTLPERFEVTLSALESMIDNLDPRTIQIVMNLEGLQAGVHEIETVVRLPANIQAGISATAVSPPVMTVEIVPRD